MTSILKIVLWMFQKMCISEFDILFVIYFYLLINLKLLTIITILIINIFLYRLIHTLFLVVTKYYLSQQSQDKHFLMGNIDLGWRK
jgi:hypothetical protein